MSFRVFTTEAFNKDFKNLTKDEQVRIKNIRDKQLKNSPYVGKPLNYTWFREKKIAGKRLYFLIYDDLCAVLIVAWSDKKTQQATINSIKLALDFYKEDVRKQLSRSIQ